MPWRSVAAAVLWPLLVLGGGLVFAPVAGAHADIEEQVARLTDQIEQHPDDAVLYLQRADLHRYHREWDLARADYARAGQLDPELDGVLLGVATLDLESGDPGATLRTVDRYLDRHPDTAQGWVVRARARAELGRSLPAAADYDRAVEAIIAGGRAPSPELYIERARVLREVGAAQAERALAGLDEGRVRLGGPVSLEIEAIGLERQFGKTDAALARVDRLAAAAVHPESWLVLRGEILEQAGRSEEAGETYRTALAKLAERPANRRGVPALRALEREIRTALTRLGAAEDTRPRRGTTR